MKKFLIAILPMILAVLVILPTLHVIDVSRPIAIFISGAIGGIVGGGSARVIDKIFKNKECKEA